MRDELQYTAGLLETCKAELLEDFAAWFRNTYGQDLTDEAGVSGINKETSLLLVTAYCTTP